MSIREIRTWRFLCDMCLRDGPIVHSESRPALPSDWSRQAVHGCGLTGYSTTRTYCEDCTYKRAQRDA